jgi:VIT1/CCC1 family predicted Fe2+/Mn2+ transporter
MSNFIKNSNKAGLIGGGAIVLGAVLFIIWAAFGEADWMSGGASTALILLATALIIFAVAYIATKSGRKGQ